VNWTSRLFARNINRQIKPLGVSAGQLPVLLALAEVGGLTQKQIVQRSAIEQSTMAATIARMEKGGLILRAPDPLDRRASRFDLTAQGRGVLESLYTALTVGNEDALIGFSEIEVRQCLGFLQRIIANLTPASDQDGWRIDEAATVNFQEGRDPCMAEIATSHSDESASPHAQPSPGLK
jgi:DNA-binding MarR family transcriptional regulator